MKTPMHMSMGEEAIVSGVCHALSKRDFVFGTYRSHGIFLAKTMNTDGFFAEMYGRESGILKGKGGSMHLSDPKNGLLATSAVVGSTIPVSVGASFFQKKTMSGGISVVFLGDGAIDEGTFWESLNMACLFRLPVLFICEDNGFAVHTPTVMRHGYKSISEIVSKFDCFVFSENTTDPEVVYGLTKKARRLILKKSKPVFLYLRYYRYLEHVGTHEDFSAGYRKQDEYKSWLKKDPLKMLIISLKNMGFDNKELQKISLSVDLQIQKSVIKAKKSNFAGAGELLKNIFYEK